MPETDPIGELCSQFDKTLRTQIDSQKYTKAIDEIFNNLIASKSLQDDSQDLNKIEEVFTRTYLDHSETRAYLGKRIKENLSRALGLFELLKTKSVHVLIGTFKDGEDSLPILREIQHRIHYGEDPHVQYLLSCVVQLLNKFSFTNFSDVKFLVRELCLRIREPEFKSMVLIIFSQLVNLYNDEFEDSFLEFVDTLILEAENEIGNDPVSLLVEILSVLYPALSKMCSKVILGKRLDTLLQKRIDSDPDDESFVKDSLRLLSIACIDEDVRGYIAENYMPLLERALNIDSYRVYAALVVIKTWSFSKLKNCNIEQVTNILVDCLVKEDNDTKDADRQLSLAIEGLAYLSLRTEVKVILRHNQNFIQHIVSMIKGQCKDEKFYGLMVIMANLSQLPRDRSAPKSLDNVLSPRRATNKESGDDDPAFVVEFNESNILSNELLSFLNSKFPDLTSGSRQQLVRIIYNVTRTRENIHKCISQGSCTSILQYLISSGEEAPSPDIGRVKRRSSVNTGRDDEGVRMLALRSLTRMLIYTNPSLIFNKYSPLNALPYLFELLPDVAASDTGTFGEEETNFFLQSSRSSDEGLKFADEVESLLALTNLASSSGTDGEDICKTVVSNPVYWATIEGLILDEHPIIQRSTLELICNMMNHPVPLASKFFNFENPKSLRNFNILVKLLMLDDIKSQRAVAAIFANIANAIPFISQDLLKQDELIKNAINVFHDQIDDVELRQRLIMLFYALFELAPQAGSESDSDFQRILKFDECQKLRDALKVAASEEDSDSEFGDVIPAILSKFQA